MEVKEKMSITIDCEREVSSLIEIDIEVNENQKTHIQSLIDGEVWDDVIELLDNEYQININIPNRDDVFDEFTLGYLINDIHINK